MVWLEELQQISSRLAQRHDSQVLRLASMYQLFHALSQHHGPMQHNLNILALAQCVHARLAEIGADPLAFEQALIDLQHMQMTLRELAVLPEDVDVAQARGGWRAVQQRLQGN